MDLSQVNVLAELERFGQLVEFGGGEDTAKIKCPFHDDNSPSCVLPAGRMGTS